ncbi:MAG: hypothetical protein M3O15_00025 [Acidobacteriota bacterium]|nr:hypothetical protein [Acidobacteriota bacterium]
MRSSRAAALLPNSSGRTAVRPDGAGHPPAARGPLQLELFGPAAQVERYPGSGEIARPRGVPRPTDPDTPRLELERRLTRLTRGRLQSLTLTDNRRTILSVRPGPLQKGHKPGGSPATLALRIHRSFLTAPDEVLHAVATFLESKKGSDRARQALVVIREHFALHRGPATARQRRQAVQPVGATIDLACIAADLNRRYFGDRLTVRITWGKASVGATHRCGRVRTTSLQLGSYSYEDKLIRVHRVLDNPEIPRYVVESIVYHELLHADLPPVVRQGRRYFHTPEFRRRERLFRHFEKADRWVHDNLPLLLRARHSPRLEAARRPR